MTLCVDRGGLRLTDAPAQMIREAARAAGGHAMRWRSQELADRAPGDTEPMGAPLKGPLERIHRELKAAFDPDAIFNRGRLVPGL